MTHHFQNSGFSYSPYAKSATSEEFRSNGISRVVLVTVSGDQLPPIFYGKELLQWMRAIMLEPGKRIEFRPSDFVLDTLPKALLSFSAPAQPENFPFNPRFVRGEILRDEAGRFYEKIGSQVRPLHQLISGPHGEIYDLAPSAPKISPNRILPAKPPPAHSEPARPQEKRGADQNGDASQKAEAFSAPATPRPPSATFRKLFPGLGVLRLVRWGDFKPMLACQLAHAEGLPDEQRLHCHVQIYEVMATQRPEALAAAVLGSGQNMNQLQPFTDAIATKVGLETILQQRPRVPANIRREPGMLLPHDLIFRLQPAKNPARDGMVHERVQSPPNATTQKREIPPPFLKLNEFQLSREEVLYDMRLEKFSRGLLASLFGWLKNLFAGNAAFRKWQTLLQGKNLEEQLWAVRPPKGMLSHPAIRDWACGTLEQAGYEARTMLLEWEIFWRRKGI